ncbi:hypothetical protein ACMA1I_16155 [Pontibacter sp. 13R65]|uniref:hypothetical protein n=1 Tax=Pontibacter sp. 13R65 TaxID=3127458 RepID=UPI00301DECCE
MSTVGEHNPEWLPRAAFNDTFDWTKSVKTTFLTFFEYVTLHDSYWQTINLSVTNETILTIQLDAFWNKEYTLKVENTDNWPFLIIKVPNVLNVSYNTVDFATTIIDSFSEIIQQEELLKLVGPLTESILFPKEFYNRLINCKEVHKTRFVDVYGGNIELLHESEIYILLMEHNGTYIDPALDKVVRFEQRAEEPKEEKRIIPKLWDKLTGKQ